MPDPGDRILTEAELLEALDVVGRLERGACASVVLAWTAADHRAWVTLSRAGYVETSFSLWCRTEAFRWTRIRATPAGRLWRRQVLAARERGVADTP